MFITLSDNRVCDSVTSSVFLLSSLIMWHQQVRGMQVSGSYYLYDSCGDMQEGIALHVENGKSHRQSFFPRAADRSVMRSMPHLLKRGTAVSRGDHGRAIQPGSPHKSKEHDVIHGTCRGTQVLLTGNPHRIILISRSPFWQALGYLM